MLAAKCSLSIRVDALGEHTDAHVGLEGREKVTHHSRCCFGTARPEQAEPSLLVGSVHCCTPFYSGVGLLSLQRVSCIRMQVVQDRQRFLLVKMSVRHAQSPLAEPRSLAVCCAALKQGDSISRVLDLRGREGLHALALEFALTSLANGMFCFLHTTC